MNIKKITCLCAIVLSSFAHAQVINLGPKLLPQEEAFAIQAFLIDEQITFNVDVADGYYLYRNRLSLKSLNDENEISELDTPDGIVTNDEFFGEVEIYKTPVSFTASRLTGNNESDLLVEYIQQGCADIGVCYPPYISTYVFPASGGEGQLVSNNLSNFTANVQEPISNTNSLFDTLTNSSLLTILFVFFSGGLLLSFTPCVLPMIPIVLTVTTSNNTHGSKSILLGVIYVLSMAVIYTFLGVLTAKTSETFLASYLQNPLVLIPFALFFVLLGIAMYFDFNFQLLPNAVRNKLSNIKNKAGTVNGAIVAGVISAIVVSPCVAAPLVGALLFIATTGDVVIGGLALFALAIGMGVLPLICASGAESFLPKTGAVHLVIKKIIAIFLIALGVWVSGGLIPVPLKLLVYGILAMFACYLLITLIKKELKVWWTKAITYMLNYAIFALAIVMLIGAFSNATNELAPLSHLFKDDKQINFIAVNNLNDYNDLQKKSIYLKNRFEFYTANWCVTCSELEGYTLNDQTIANFLQENNFQSIKVDLSDINDDTKKLLAMNNLFGPPAIIVKNSGGNKLLHLTGYVSKEELLANLEKLNI